MGGVTLVSFIIHFSLYAVLGFLVGRVLAGSEQISPVLFILALALCTAFGFFNEIYQQLIPERVFERIGFMSITKEADMGLNIFAMKNDN